MIQSLAFSVCLLFLVLVQPVAASPRTDADHIAALFVRSDEYRTQLHDMITMARVDGVRHTLSKHSVKVRDQEKLTELLSQFNIPDVVFDTIQKAVADRLIERMGPDELRSLADYARNQGRDSDAPRAGAMAAGKEKVMTLDEFRKVPDEIAGLAEDPAFKNEMVSMSLGIMMIGLAVQATNSINTQPKPSKIADLLEVEGVFSFPNPIARKNLIRDLRAAKP